MTDLPVLREVPPHEWASLAPLLFAWNRRADGGVHCLHADQGADLASHVAELAALPPHEAAFWIVAAGDATIGLIGCEIDHALRRAWLRGPLVADPAAREPLRTLALPALQAALPEVLQFDAFSAADGPWLGDWYAAAGFVPQQLHRVLEAPVGAAPSAASGVERATPADVDGIVALHAALFPAAYLVAADFVRALAADDRALFVVRDDAGAALGYLHAEDRPAQHEVYVDYLGVLEAQRGRGHGRALLQAAFAWAAARGRPRLALTVREDRPRALTLYRQAGFVEVSTGRHWRWQRAG